MSDDTETYAEIAEMAKRAEQIETAVLEASQPFTKGFKAVDAGDIVIEGLARAFVSAMIKRREAVEGPPISPDELLEFVVHAPWKHTIEQKLDSVIRGAQEKDRAARAAARPPLSEEALLAAMLILKLQASGNVLKAVLAIDTPIDNETLFLQAVLEGTAQALLHLINHRMLSEHRRDASPEELVTMVQDLPWPSLVADLIARKTAHGIGKPPAGN